jgi:hypothetical protein
MKALFNKKRRIRILLFIIELLQKWSPSNSIRETGY